MSSSILAGGLALAATLMLAAGAHAVEKDQSRIPQSPDVGELLMDPPPYEQEGEEGTNKDQSRVARPPAPPTPPDLVAPPRAGADRQTNVQVPAEAMDRVMPPMTADSTPPPRKSDVQVPAQTMEKVLPQMTAERQVRRRPAG